jgi:hypothetical protein
MPEITAPPIDPMIPRCFCKPNTTERCTARGCKNMLRFDMEKAKRDELDFYKCEAVYQKRQAAKWQAIAAFVMLLSALAGLVLLAIKA